MNAFTHNSNPDPSALTGSINWAFKQEIISGSYTYKVSTKAEISPKSTSPVWQILRVHNTSKEETYPLVSGKCESGFTQQLYDGIQLTITAYLDSLTYFAPGPSALGSDLITNGAFATDTDWTKGTGWTIAAGTADCSTAADDIAITSAASVITVGSEYTVFFDVLNYASGALQVADTGTFEGNLVVADGSYTQTFTATATGAIKFMSSAAFVGSIDNVVLRELT